VRIAPDYDAVAQRLKEKGWQQGSFGGPEGPNCVVGALLEVHPFTMIDLSDLRDVIAEQYPESVGRRITQVNDDPFMTLDGILTVLDKAARKVEERA
jgi:hypothetical protein